MSPVTPWGRLGRRLRRLALPALGGLLLGAAPAAAQEDPGDYLRYSLNGGLRVRGLHLRNGTLANQLDPTTLNSLRISGRDEIDASQSFFDTRLRLQLKITAVEEVTALLAIEVGDITFGVANAGGGLGTDGVVFENKNLYLEWHPTRYSFRLRGGLYARESDPYGLILSNDVAGVHGAVELLGTSTALYADYIKAVETSRLDLDGDGVIDNDYNDRNIIIAGLTSTAIPEVALEAFFVADIDDTQDTPVAANTERDVYWAGLNARTHVGPVRISSTGIWAYGKRTVTGTPGTTIKGFAFDQRLLVELPFVTVEGIFGWASGRDPDRRTTDTGFPTITPFYGVSGIVYANFGGFNASGSDLSGTAHATLKLRAHPVEDLEVEAVFLWAWYTEDRDVSAHVNRFDSDARDLGFEMDLNLSYQVVEGFKAFARGSILFPGKGYLVERDIRDNGALSQIIVGAQFGF